jgi:hypothetical protein
MMWRTIARTLLTWCRLIRRPELVAKMSSRHPTPNALRPGTLVVVRDGGIDKWACLRCPGGCGEKIQLSLSEKRRPRWGVTIDRLGRPTVTPSVNVLNACGCHFWIRGGNIDWTGSPSPCAFTRSSPPTQA